MEEKLVQVRLREGRKPKRYLLPDHLDAEPGQWVVVPDEEEEDCGVVATDPVPLPAEWEGSGIPRVLEVPSQQEIEKARRLRKEREPDAIRLAYEKVRDRNLELKLVQARYYHRSNKMKIHFTAENRVDFRELVKDLASVFHARIEMRQIGVRDAAGMVGGYGVCGEELCCTRFLEEFAPITIRMAKDQYLALNPGKISGCCGRLLCCLRYEHETYAEAKKSFPRLGSTSGLGGQPARVTGVNVLKGTVNLSTEGHVAEVSLEEFKRQNEDWRHVSISKSNGAAVSEDTGDLAQEEVDEEALSMLEDTVVRKQSSEEGAKTPEGPTEESSSKRRRKRRRRPKNDGPGPS